MRRPNIASSGRTILRHSSWGMLTTISKRAISLTRTENSRLIRMKASENVGANAQQGKATGIHSMVMSYNRKTLTTPKTTRKPILRKRD